MKVYLLDRVDNIVAKGETVHHEEFPTLPKCFQKLSAAGVKKSLHVKG